MRGAAWGGYTHTAQSTITVSCFSMQCPGSRYGPRRWQEETAKARTELHAAHTALNDITNNVKQLASRHHTS